MLIEACVGSYEDAVMAAEGGADRLELNSALALGGLTPSYGAFILVRQAVTIPIIAMVRPRPGGFSYSEEEKTVMLADAKFLLDQGADGLVFGCLKEDGCLDEDANRALIDLCHKAGKEAVFHRAFDVAADPWTAVADLAVWGCDRILTSGQAVTAPEGADLLARLIQTYGDKIEFCLGSGVNASNALALANQTGANQLHASFGKWRQDKTSHGQGGVDFGSGSQGDYQALDISKLKAMVDLFK